MDEKLTRLIEILQEAKSIIKEIEEEIKPCQKSNYDDFRLDCLDAPYSLYRVINVAKTLEIYTLGELLKYSKLEVMNFPHLGKRSVNHFSDFLERKYNIVWK